MATNSANGKQKEQGMKLTQRAEFLNDRKIIRMLDRAARVIRKRHPRTFEYCVTNTEVLARSLRLLGEPTSLREIVELRKIVPESFFVTRDIPGGCDGLCWDTFETDPTTSNDREDRQ